MSVIVDDCLASFVFKNAKRWTKHFRIQTSYIYETVCLNFNGSSLADYAGRICVFPSEHTHFVVYRGSGLSVLPSVYIPLMPWTMI